MGARECQQVRWAGCNRHQKRAMTRIGTLRKETSQGIKCIDQVALFLKQSSKVFNSPGSKTESELLVLPLDNLDELEQVNYTPLTQFPSLENDASLTVSLPSLGERL